MRPFAFLLGYFIFWVPAGLCAQSTPNQFPQATLDDGTVRMQLYLPDPDHGSYRATRFDWSGIISSVQYEGHEYFGYWKKTHDPMVHEDLSGPAESYQDPGLGYAEAKPGEGFIRIGVGVLEKVDEPAYNGFKTYAVLDYGKWKIRKGKKQIRFRHQASSDLGYAYTYTKTIKLTKDRPGFIIDHELKNTGRKTIRTDQFNHNFFIIDGEPTGPNLEVRLPFSPRTENDLKGLVKFTEEKLEFLQPFEQTSVWMNLRGFGPAIDQHTFTVRNKRTGAGVTLRMDQPLYQLDFWACQTTYCPENYVYIEVEPGKRFRWRATYELFVEPPE